MMQLNIFDLTMPIFEIDKPIRLTEVFAGVGSQAMALRDLGVDFEHYRVVEFDKFPIASYNAIHGTDFPTMDVTEIKGEDLGIVDTDKYCYILTYSFPCQDLSNAGNRGGMNKGSGTRSGLLWEVERLLNEVKNLPQVLLMENVPAVAQNANIKNFHLWQDFLSSKGYTNHTENLNTRDFGVAQNRERTFMVSLLGDYNYKFPQPVPLTKTIADYLEDDVDEKYYINSDRAKKLIATLNENNFVGGVQNSDRCQLEESTGDIGCELHKSREYAHHELEPGGGCSNRIQVVGSLKPEKNVQQRVKVYSTAGISPTLNAVDYKDPVKTLEVTNESEADRKPSR